MARSELPLFASDNKMIANLQSGWAKILNPIIKQSQQRTGIAASHTQGHTLSSDPIIVPFNSISADIDGALTPAGAYTVKHKGAYLIGCNMNVTNAALFTLSDFLHAQIMQNSSKQSYQRAYGTGATYQLGLHIAAGVGCQAGDTLCILASCSLAGTTFDASTNLYLMRIG